MILFKWSGFEFFLLCSHWVGCVWDFRVSFSMELWRSVGGLFKFIVMCGFVVWLSFEFCVCALVCLCLLWELLVLVVLLMKIVKKVMVWKVMVVVILKGGYVVWSIVKFFKCIFFGSYVLFASNHDHKFWTILIIEDFQKSKFKTCAPKGSAHGAIFISILKPSVKLRIFGGCLNKTKHVYIFRFREKHSTKQ